MQDIQQVMVFVERLVAQDIGKAVKILEETPRKDAAAILANMSPESVAQIIRRLQTSFSATLLEERNVESAASILTSLPPNQAASIVMHLSTQSRDRLLPHISGTLLEKIRDLYTYPEGSVGRYMSTDYLTFLKHEEAGDVIEKIRALASKKTFPASYAYVVDDDGILQGVLNMRDLMLARPEQPLSSFMIANVYTLHCFLDRSEATREMAKRKYFAAPIVDNENRILGVIKAENLLTGLKEDVTADLLKMVGAGGDEKTFSPISFALKKRLLWLNVNLVTAFLAAAVVAMFEGIIAKITILAIFLPVIAGQGGNAGAQSLAVVMRGLVMREIPAKRVRELIWKETRLGAINGVAIGIVTALIAWLWHGNPWLGLVIGLGMILNLAIAGLAGSSIPILMKKMGIDPAQSSSIILTTVTDVMGFLAFLGLAVIFQDYLI
ncbi:Mg2+ transporter MgtE [Desulfocapsa sulfexigens DSM 10523]|uniref:Magnesium transporter MgtE n=1 Tax=Desulfocapsa sulfexigens (strain DSM 10523 / SB164P1) TaxID=1167006 RepID=M1NH44_DESSD|nr:magnesium transporter [Desulfocapsa sulfexigens]AGF78934.1 Mg2+ transporter MgtE [Desulfocapsa sulfexigens DSM 10523]